MFADPQDSFDLNGDFFIKIIPNIFGVSEFLRTFTSTNKYKRLKKHYETIKKNRSSRRIY